VGRVRSHHVRGSTCHYHRGLATRLSLECRHRLAFLEYWWIEEQVDTSNGRRPPATSVFLLISRLDRDYRILCCDPTHVHGVPHTCNSALTKTRRTSQVRWRGPDWSTTTTSPSCAGRTRQPRGIGRCVGMNVRGGFDYIYPLWRYTCTCGIIKKIGVLNTPSSLNPVLGQTIVGASVKRRGHIQ
jgi:hypothetical protein